MDLADRDRRLSRAESLLAGPRRPRRRRGRDQLRRQRRHLPGQVRAARPAAGAGRVGRRLLHGLRLLPLRRLGGRAARRRRPRSATSGSSPTSTGWSCWPPSRAGRGRRATGSPRPASPTRSTRGCCCARLVDDLADRGASACCRRSRSSGSVSYEGDDVRARGGRPGVRPDPADERLGLLPRRARRARRAGRRGRAVPPRVRRGAARAVGRPGVAGARRRHVGAGPHDDPGGRRDATACARRSRRRSTPPASATAGTSTSACGATGGT